MSRFVLTAQLQLQAPRNVNQVVGQIQRQLNGVNVNLNVQGGRQATRQIAQVNQQVNNLNKGAKNLGKNFGVSVKRFAAFSIANRAVSLFASKLSGAIEESIDFQRELIKIKQVSGATTQALSNLTKSITELSTGLGASSKDLLATSRILAQTGLQAAQLEVALSALAKTTLAPTFENIEKTAEGAVAILAQFGQGVGALESQLGSINAVAGQFAVESGDLISAVRRTGGVFKSAGGDLNELLGLFTSVRATTRESAESIATGLRTIFTRIQRPKTIEFLKQYGIELTNLEGKFVGPFDAVRQLSQSLQGLEEGDIRFVQIAEELGGFRQIGKVIPLIQQFETAERARAAAVAGSTSLDKDAQTAQEALAVQIQKTRENFLALIRSLSETTSFQVLVKTTLGLADALIKVSDALSPIVPLLGAFAGLKIAKGLGNFAGGLRGAFTTRNAGGPIGFATGGVVPGTGNRDTVPAMLTPGEFVIRKSSVKKLGAGTLAQMNNNRYAVGGKVKIQDSIGYVTAKQGEVAQDGLNADKVVSLASLRKRGINPRGSSGLDGRTRVDLEIPYRKLAVSSPKDSDFAGATATNMALEGIDKYLNSGVRKSGFPARPRSNISGDSSAKASLNGYIFEQILTKFGGKAAEGGQTPFDFVGIKNLANSLENDPVPKFLDAARTKKEKSDIRKKALNAIKEQGLKYTSSGFTKRRNAFFGGAIQKFALGGLATKNRVGFAILDPDEGGADLDASVTRAQIRGAVKGTDAQKKALDKELSWTSKNYKVSRQGLPAKTSQKFYDTITQEATEGVGRAASSLSQTLGQGSVSMPDTAKQTMNDVIKKSGAQMGRLFEDVLNVIDNRGPFKPAPTGAFWDFKTGLTGGLASTYNKMPSSFVDARTSYGRSNAGAAQSKIIGEIAEEYERSSTYKTAKKQSKAVPASALAAQEKRRAKQAAKMAKMREQAGFAKGGAASDTVPALLTPGEFVINAKSASKIGKANLDRMNKKGVAGFAAGGSVGKVQRFNNGGPSQAAGSARGGIDAAALAFLLPTVLDSMIPTVEKTDEEIEQLGSRSINVRDALSELVTTVGITSVALSTFGVNLKGLPALIRKQFSGGGIRSVDIARKRFVGGFQRGETARKSGVAPKRETGLFARAGSRLGGSGSTRTAKGISKSLELVSKFGGRFLIVGGALLAFNKMLNAGLGLQEKYNNATKLGNVERAKELAVLKQVPAVVALFGESVSEGVIKFKEFFGGATLDSIKANAEAQALAGKTTKEYEENTKLADQALRDLKDGVRSAADAFRSGDLTRNLQNTINQGAAEIKAAQEETESNLNRFFGVIENFYAETIGLGTSDKDIKELGLEKEAKARAEAFSAVEKELDGLTEANRQANKEIIMTGKGFSDYRKNLEEGLDSVDITKVIDLATAEKLGKAFENQQKNIIDNLKVARALNNDLFFLDANIKALNVSLSDSIGQIEGTFNQFSSAVNTLEAVSKGAGIQSDVFEKKLSVINSVLGDLGAGGGVSDRLTKRFKDLNTVTTGLTPAIQKLQQQVAEDPIGTFDQSTSFKEKLGTELAGLLGNKGPLADALSGQTAGIFKDIDFDFDEGAEEISKKIVEALGKTFDSETFKQLIELDKNRAKIVKLLTQAEENLISTKLQAIEVEQRGAQTLEDFGIKSFTVGKRMELLGKSVTEGVGAEFNTTTKSLTTALSQARDAIDQENRKIFSSGGPQTQRALEESNKTVTQQTRIIENINKVTQQRITIEKEALKLAKEKIRLDQESIDSLASGDIEGFLNKQSAAAARRSLISGNVGAVGAFDFESVLTALKSITDPDEKRAAQQTAILSGIPESIAKTITEDTPEIRAIRENVDETVKLQQQLAAATVANQELKTTLQEARAAEAEQELIASVSRNAAAAEKSGEIEAALDKQIESQLTALDKNTKAITDFTTIVGKQIESETAKKAQEFSSVDKAIDSRLFGGKGKAEGFIPLLGADPTFTVPDEQTSTAKNLRRRGASSTVRDYFNENLNPVSRKIFDLLFGITGSATNPDQLYKRRGGLIYASNGMFVPRGTDTVPAMLTPGEFVVNRKAVNTGNNRQVLETMNGGASGQNGVYYNNGGEVAPSIDTTALKAIATSLSSSFNKFNDTVNRLINFKFEMTIAPTRVDVVINTPQAMEQMSSQAKEQLLTAVVDEISINQLGKLRRNRNA